MRLSGALQKKTNSELSYREIVKNSSNDETVAAKQVTRDSRLAGQQELLGRACMPWQEGGVASDAPCWSPWQGRQPCRLMNVAWSKRAPFWVFQCGRESYLKCVGGHGGDGSTLGRTGNFKY